MSTLPETRLDRLVPLMSIDEARPLLQNAFDIMNPWYKTVVLTHNLRIGQFVSPGAIAIEALKTGNCSIVLSWIFFAERNNDLVTNPDPSKCAVNKFCDSLGRVRKYPNIFTPLERLFVIAHEYAHILYAHSRWKNTKATVLWRQRFPQLQREEFDKLAAIAQEIQANNFAIRLTLNGDYSKMPFEKLYFEKDCERLPIGDIIQWLLDNPNSKSNQLANERKPGKKLKIIIRRGKPTDGDGEPIDLSDYDEIEIEEEEGDPLEHVKFTQDEDGNVVEGDAGGDYETVVKQQNQKFTNATKQANAKHGQGSPSGVADLLAEFEPDDKVTLKLNVPATLKAILRPITEAEIDTYSRVNARSGKGIIKKGKSTRPKNGARILAMLDISGSMSAKEINKGLGVLHNTGLPVDIKLFNTKIEDEVYTVDDWRKLDKIKLKSGGGTSFTPVINHIADKINDYSFIVVFSDGGFYESTYIIPDPVSKNHKKVCWVITTYDDSGKGAVISNSENGAEFQARLGNHAGKILVV